MGSVPGWETKILHVKQHGLKNKINYIFKKKKKTLSINSRMETVMIYGSKCKWSSATWSNKDDSQKHND